jgi:hypothetical protein
MAQTDAMETAKEILRQIIKYRFWISIGVASLFAVIAYSVGSGPIREAAAKETAAITAAESEVKGYMSSTIPTKEYKPIVDEKTQVLTGDVNTAWRTLYDRQAPLLTWPGEVGERFKSWGRQWPEKVEPKKVELGKVDYIAAYPAYVSMVYKTFNPFNYETGEGVVSAPPESALLLPVQFDDEHLPDLGKIWAAQERLWIQRTVLEVIAEVNKTAKKWDEAIIRQIVSLEVGSPETQDQRSLAKAETLEESKPIYAPGEEPAADGTAATADPMAGKGGGMGMMGGSRRGMGEMAGMGGGAGVGSGPESVFYVKSDSDKYKILPLAVTVLIEQDRVQDFLVELENSPMWIQVKDFELVRAPSRVTKPEKGEASSLGMMGGGMMAGMMGGGMGRMGRMGGGMTGMGGMMQQMEQMQQSMMSQRGNGMGSMYGMGGGGMGMQPDRKKSGKDTRKEDRAGDRKKVEKAIDESKGVSFSDPFFNIVQVKVYGQARFFNAPPADAAPPPSTAETTAAASAPAGADSKNGETKAQPATAKPGEKAGEPKAEDETAAEPKEKDAGAAAKPATATGKSNSEKSTGTEKSGSETAKSAKAAAPAGKTGPAEDKGTEPKP